VKHGSATSGRGRSRPPRRSGATPRGVTNASRTVLAGSVFHRRYGLRWLDPPRELGYCSAGRAAAEADRRQGGRGGAIGETLPKGPPGLSWAGLEQAVRARLGVDALQLAGVHFAPVQEDWATEPGYRVTGQARVLGYGAGVDPVPWSLTAKLLRKPEPGGAGPVGALDPRHPAYWRREALAYAAGLPAEAPGLGAPRCFSVDAPSEDAHVLWLEPLADERAGRWPLERYGRAAQHLGAFNGAYLAGACPLPQQPWLCTDFHRGRLDRFPWTLDVFAGEAFWQRPLVRRFMDGPTRARQRRLVADRAALERRLAALPPTLAHNQAMRRSLLAVSVAGRPEALAAVDWGLVGVSPVGTDAGCLFGWARGLTEVQEHELRPLAQLVLDGYLAGLRAAGWRGDARAARTGFAATAALHALMWVPFILVTDEARRDGLAQKYQTDPDTMAATHAASLTLLHELADEALAA